MNAHLNMIGTAVPGHDIHGAFIAWARARLPERERTVTELENLLSLRQPMVSQQLARLRLDQLVTTRRDGKTMYYSIANDDVRRVVALIYDIFCGAGAADNPRS